MTPEGRARKMLHEYGINTEPYTRNGGDHPMMDFLLKLQREAVEEEREEIAQFIETHTVAYSEAKVVKAAHRPAASQVALATAIRDRGKRDG